MFAQRKKEEPRMKNMDPSVALGEQEISCTIFESNVKNLESRSAGKERGEGGAARSRCPFISSVRGRWLLRNARQG